MAKDDPRHQYHCDHNHTIASTKPLERCPAVVKGVPCPGKLTRYGAGSRTKVSQ